MPVTSRLQLETKVLSLSRFDVDANFSRIFFSNCQFSYSVQQTFSHQGRRQRKLVFKQPLINIKLAPLLLCAAQHCLHMLLTRTWRKAWPTTVNLLPSHKHVLGKMHARQSSHRPARRKFARNGKCKNGSSATTAAASAAWDWNFQRCQLRARPG